MTVFNKYKTRGAYHYEWYKNNTFDYKDCVDRCVEFCKGSTLDVGCGDGVVVKKLLEKGIVAYGYDNDSEGIKLAREKCESLSLYNFTTFTEVDINKSLGVKADYMVCLNVIEHLEHPEAVKRIFDKNITKAAIIITDIPQGELPPEHYHEYTPEELKQMFDKWEVKPFKIGKDFHGIEIYK